MIVQIAAYWGLAEAALVVATVLLTGHMLNGRRAWALGGQLLTLAGVLLLGVALTLRGARGHGWPIVSWADTAAGIGVLMLLVYLIWSSATGSECSGAPIVPIALGLAVLGAAQQVTAPVTMLLSQTDRIVGSSATLLSGAFLGLSAGTGLSGLARLALQRRFAHGRWLDERTAMRWGEIWVRCGLLFLVVALVADVWLGQQFDLDAANNARQAGIAIGWMIYFVALRLKSHPRWQSWAWDAVQVIGFACMLPILLDVPWLNQPLF